MKKSICILACALTLALTGCQKQIEQFDTETNSSTTTSNSFTDLGSISENDTVNSETNFDQVDKNNDTIYDDDLSNTDTSSNQTNSKDNSEADTPYDDNSSNTETSSDQVVGKDDTGANTSSEDELAGEPTLPEEISGEVNLTGNDPSGAVTIVEQVGERQLKSEGSRRGEIEVTHKLSIGKAELSKGDILLFHIETKSAEAELKITLIGAKTGITLEERITGSGDISFKIDTTDEYTVILENCSLRGVQFTIDYSIGCAV